jgi:pimeloyl-ACP methyl ester carboxylesterase
VRAADGVPLAYDMRGRGETTLVFVHCWACDRSFWREQLDEFARDHRVVSLDLPGHGASGAGREQWSLAGLARDVQTVVESLQLQRVILIGHSMGGPVSLLAASRMPGRVAGVVGVDTLHNAEFAWPKEMAEQFASRFDTNYSATLSAAVRSMFPTNADTALVNWVTTKAHSADRKATLALLRDFPNLDMKKAFAEAKVPIRCVNAVPHGNSGFPTVLETNRKYADYDAVLIDGVGHYLQLERPAEFNARLKEIVTALAR